MDRRRERAAVAALAKACGDDVAALLDAIAEVQAASAWKPAFRACGRLGDAPQRVRMAFLDIWIAWGEQLRSNMANDFVTLAALRVLLPPYEGGPVRLFRGESLGNQQRRTYRMSWSADEEIAAGFARNSADRYGGGTVLIETLAPANPNYTVSYWPLASDLAHTGRLVEARAVVSRLSALLPNLSLRSLPEVIVFKPSGRLEFILEGLRKAGVPSDGPPRAQHSWRAKLDQLGPAGSCVHQQSEEYHDH